MSDNIYKRVATHVTQLFEQNPHPNLLFHNLAHTTKVVERAQEIAAHYQLSEADTLTIYVAAWFHDVGHLFTEMDKHEEKGVEIMRKYMQEETKADEALIAGIADCILATKPTWQPKKTVEEILCDADTYHFGTKEFKITNKLTKKEFALRGYDMLLKDWKNNTIALLEKHVFFTSYCKALLDEGKQKNIAWLKQKAQETDTSNEHHGLFPGGDDKDSKKNEASLLARGLQTMLRLTSSNHFHLSEMADRKANILISVNSILIGVILSVLVGKLSDNRYLTIPAIVFLGSCLATIIVAILATRPKITEGTFSKEDILTKKTNLLFFGNFYKSSLEEYAWAMSLLMNDNEYLYGSLVKDVYQIGVVLGRKYRLIRLAYTIFMIGLIATVATFFVATLINYGQVDSGTVVTNSSSSPF